MLIVYQILSFLISLAAMIIGISLFLLLPMSLGTPALWLPTFILIAIVLYSWFSSRFRTSVLLRQQPVKLSLRDWIRVNGFVAIGFTILNIPTTITILANPTRFADAMREVLKQLGPKYEQGIQPEKFTPVAVIMLIYLLALLVHVLWTFSLIKKHRNFFQ